METTKQTVFVVHRQYYWGKGLTLTEAMKNAGVKFNDPYTFIILKDADYESVYVDDLGGTNWKEGELVFNSADSGTPQPALGTLFKVDDLKTKVMDKLDEHGGSDENYNSSVMKLDSIFDRPYIDDVMGQDVV